MTTVKYSPGYQPAVIATHKWRSAENSAAFLLPHLRKTYHLLDVGSGAGTITCDLTSYVKSVTALEVNEHAMEITRKEAKLRGIELKYTVSDVCSMPFEDNTFDVVHVHQVLQHVADPVKALNEIRRVTKLGGIVAVTEAISSAFSWYPEFSMLDDWLKLYRNLAISNGGQPDAGTRLLDWAQRVGFTHIKPGSSTWCFATAEEREYWGGAWENRVLTANMAEDARIKHIPEETLEKMSQAWAHWKKCNNGCMIIPHGNILAKK